MSSSEIVAKREAILIPVRKQWIAKDIPSFTAADQNARKLLSTDLVNTNEKCYSSWFLLAWVQAPQWEERSNKENKYRRARRVERWIGEGERAAEPGDMHAFDDWSNVFMLTDSRCCWQYRALSVSRSCNSGKDFWKHGFRASNWQISLRDLRGPFLRTSGFDPRKRRLRMGGRLKRIVIALCGRFSSK